MFRVAVMAAFAAVGSTGYCEKLDQYSGLTAVQCAAGPKPHFYTEQIAERLWICDPAGHGFFLKGVTLVAANVDSAQLALYPTKYVKGRTSVWQLNWSLQMARRLQAWGFNTIADDSYALMLPVVKDSRWGTPDHRIPVKLPFVFNTNTTRYMFENIANCNQPSAIKDLAHGMGPAFTSYPYSYGDYFDPHTAGCIDGIIRFSPLHQYATDVDNAYLVYITFDEGDQTGGLISSAGQDFATAPPASARIRDG
jgi:hypothetical protein